MDTQINLYEPAILVVGTKGRSLGGFQGLLPGSVSKYCLQHSPVPVIVVRPSSKRDKARVKRQLDPGRHTYKDLLGKTAGGHFLDHDHLNNFIAEETQPASDDEAAAVAAAIGFKPPVEASPLSQIHTPPAETESKTPGSTDSTDPGFTTVPDDARSPGVIMKSPELQNLDSPDISDSSSSEEEQGGVSMEPLSLNEASEANSQRSEAEVDTIGKVEPEASKTETKQEERKSTEGA